MLDRFTIRKLVPFLLQSSIDSDHDMLCRSLLNFFGVKIESNDHFDNLKVVEYEAWIRRMFQHQAFDKVKQTKLQYESEIDKMQQKHALELENKDRLIAALLKRIPKKF